MDAKVTPTGRRVGVRFSVALLAVLVGLATLLPAMASAAAVCGCTKKGAYVNPGRSLPEKGELSPEGGTFRLKLVDQTPTQVTLHVTKAATGETVKNLFLPLPRLDWGFSPDGTKLMYRHAFIDAESANPKVDVIGLWDLVNNKSVYYTETTAGSDVAFSPHGRWFMLNILLGINWSQIVVIDATSGAGAHYEELIFQPVPGYPGDKYGTMGMGFSPDDGDRTFVRAYRDNNGQIQLWARNLETGKNVMSTPVTSDSWWKFSPCGDVFGLVTQPDQVSIAVTMTKTVDGTNVGPSQWLPTSDSVRLESTLESHLIIDVTPNEGEKIITVGPNTADVPCTPAVALSSISVSPTSVVGGEANATGTVKLSGNTADPIVVSLSSSDSAAAAVPATVTVPAGSSTATFPITTQSVLAAKPVTISASAAAVSKTATLTVNPSPDVPLESVSVDPARIPGGQPTTGTVTLATAAGAAGSVVDLTSSNPNVASVPARVTVPAGQISATFPIATSAVRVDSPSRITAVGGGMTRSTTMYALTTDRDCEAGSSDPANETLKIRSFASYDDLGTNVDCVQNVTFSNGITVGAGSTGLPVGSPVTLELTTRFDGTNMSSPPLSAGGVTSEGTSTYSIVDDTASNGPEGTVQPVNFSARFNLQHYAQGVNVSKTTNISFLTNVDSPPSINTYEELTTPNAVIWDVDTGTMTAQYTTTVGAHLSMSGRVSTVASAYGSGATAIADFSNTFTASSKPAAGFEGLALTYDIGDEPPPPANQAPVCAASNGTTAEDAALVAKVSCSDAESSPLTYSVVNAPAHGTLSAIAADGGYTYTPAANYNGPDSFTVKANDGSVDSGVATVSLTVTPVNDAPVCTNGTGTTDAGKALTGSVSCSDVDGTPLTYAVSSAPTKGTVTLNATTGEFTYTPKAGTTGTDSFTVGASDGTATATATFSVTIRSVVIGPPTRLEQCLNNGWKTFNNPTFKSQTACLVYVAIHWIFK